MRQIKAWMWIVGIVVVGVALGIGMRLASSDPEPAATSTVPPTTGVITNDPIATAEPTTTPDPGTEPAPEDDHADEDHDHDETPAIAATVTEEQYLQIETLAMTAATELTREPVDETYDQRAQRLAPLVADADVAAGVNGPMRHKFEGGHVVTEPGEVEYVRVWDGSDPASVTFRVSLAFDGAHVADGESVARRYQEVAVWDVRIAMIDSAPKVTDVARVFN